MAIASAIFLERNLYQRRLPQRENSAPSHSPKQEALNVARKLVVNLDGSDDISFDSAHQDGT